MRGTLGALVVPLLLVTHSEVAPPHSGGVTSMTSAVTLAVRGVEEEVLPGITPAVTVVATRDEIDPVVASLGLRISSNSAFTGALLADTIVAATDSTVIQLTTPLPSGATVFIQAYARAPGGEELARSAVLQRQVPPWLTLISPNAPSGGILDSQRPTFVWSGADVNTPPGPWSYEFSVTATAGGPPIFAAITPDTTITVPFQLELNTSYRWSVTARLGNGSSLTVQSRSSFLIVDETIPRTTLLHQTFPNPFPSATTDFACIWFDLATPSQVLLEVLDIRTNPVRILYPDSPFAPAQLPAGRYGRAINAESGCTGEYIWDGTDELGRTVRPGVYILRMRSAGRDHFQRMVFRGR